MADSRRATTSYVIVGSQAAISESQTVISPSYRRPVLVTPVIPPKPVIKKVLLKAVVKSKGKAKDSKVFTLRNLNPNSILSCKDLMREIRAQLSEDMTGGTFDVSLAWPASFTVPGERVWSSAIGLPVLAPHDNWG